MNFKIGDKVKVVKILDIDVYEDTFVGREGVIESIDDELVYPIRVAFEGYISYAFVEEELEHVEETLPIEAIEPQEPYINIKFQEGNVLDNGINGCQIEDVIDVLVERLEGFQRGKFPCRENALAITKLEEARMWLNERTYKREIQGVEGMDKKS